MEEEDQDDRFVKLGFRPQKENVYNKLLPYADKLDEESTRLFNDIKTNLVKSVLAREIKPGCALWTSRLNKYLKIYGLKFSKEDHIALVKLYYNLLTIPNLEPVRLNKFAGTLSQLLKKRYLLSQDDLQLEWRPLYELAVRLMEKSKTAIGMYRYYHNLETQIENLIRYCRVYFPTKDTQEILDEFRPKLCPFSPDILSAIEYLEMFLPLNVRPEDADIGYNLWLEEFMQLWEVCHNACLWENSMMFLISRLASKNMGYIDWEPYVPIMFTRFLRTLNLPVNFRQKTLWKQYKINTNAIAMWIVCALHKDSCIFVHLETFMKTIETYLHPANNGRWTAKLLDFLRRISFLFVQRIHFERERRKSWETDIPQWYRLSDDLIDKFVNIMKPCIAQAIFSRGSNDISFAIQYLGTIRPNIIIPLILDKLYSSMDSLTEPHKYTSSMMCLKSVARFMVQGKSKGYPEGPTHVIPILQALLPGIDPNDMRKCIVTLTLMIQLVNAVPLVDSSEAYKYYELTEEEHLICEASAGLEDFVIQLLDRLMAWVESNSLEVVRMEHTETERSSRSEIIGENMISAIIYTILYQCSPQIYTSALRKMHNFLSSRILETKVSGRLAAVACQVFVRTNPKEAMRLFMPHFCGTVLRLLTENEDITKEEHLDTEFAYNLLVLSEMADARGEIVNYIDDLCKVLDSTLHMQSLQGSNMAAKMLMLMMTSLTIIVPEEYRSSNKPFNLPLSEFLTIREWGEPGDLKNLNISWYVPGEKEVKCAEFLLHKYLVPELNLLKRFINGDETVTREVLRRSLKIVVALISCLPLLPLWKEPVMELIETELDPWEFELIVGPSQSISMPDGSNVRKTIADTLHEVQKRILTVDEGDTKSIRIITQIYDTLVFQRMRYRDFQTRWKSFHLVKKSTEDKLHQKKKHLRHVLIDRVQLHQEFRNESRCCFFTATHKQIMLDLFELSVSRYSEVRSLAQQQLSNMVNSYPYSYTVIIDRIKEILKLDPMEHHEKFKGCLYILVNPKSSPIGCRHDWDHIKEIWPLLVCSKPSEKPSIINLLSNLTETIHRLFPTISVNVEIPDRCLAAALTLAKLNPSICDVTHFEKNRDEFENKLNIYCNQKRGAYEDTVNLIIDAAISGKLHWRHHYMALCFLRDLVHPDVPYNAKVVKYFLNALINETLNVRKIALRVVIYILIQNKPKFKKNSLKPSQLEGGETINGVIRPGLRPDNKWLLFKKENVPKNENDWENTKFVHNQHCGYYCWPKQVEFYAPSLEQLTPAKRLDKLTPQEQEIYNFFINNQNVEQLVKYLSLEEKKDMDQFNAFRVILFTNLFKTFEDCFLDVFKPHLERLVQEKHEQCHRCASEIISGIIRGSKHWSFNQVERMWSMIIPILKLAFSQLGDETTNDWVASISMALDGRDPKSVHQILEFLLQDPLSDKSSLIGCGRVFILQQALGQQPWRNPDMVNSLLTYFYEHLSHPFQNVRDRISGALTTIMSNNLRFPKGQLIGYPKISDFFTHVSPDLDLLHKLVMEKVGHSINLGKEKNTNKTDDNKDKEEIKKIDGDWERTIRTFKIVARYVTNSIMQVNFSAVPEFYKLFLLAAILQSDDIDEELATTSVNLLAVLSHCMTLKQYVPDVLTSLIKVSECPFWSARAVVPEFLQIFVFHNMATIIANEEWVKEIQSLVLRLIEDVQLEVRLKARHVLSDFLHCQFIPNPMDLLEMFKQKARTKIKKRKDSTQLKSQYDTNALRLRHAGVLGLCAFISSQPYDVPDFLPDIFSELSVHLNDPQPISATIRQTLGDFKRTHHDNWESHKMKFTEKELCVISDLTVPPSYYA